MSELSPAAQAAADTFRALCAELTAWAEKTSAHYFQPPDVLLRARAAKADGPAVPEGREPAAPPADGEVAEFVEWLQKEADDYECIGCEDSAAKCKRAAELLQQQALVPVSVGERPWEREGWCDAEGNCWLGGNSLDGCTPTWIYGPFAWAERFQNVHRILLPAHALPLPEVDE